MEDHGQATPRLVEQRSMPKISCRAMMVGEDSEKYVRLVKDLNVKIK
jgi:hypothetical protein